MTVKIFFKLPLRAPLNTLILDSNFFASLTKKACRTSVDTLGISDNKFKFFHDKFLLLGNIEDEIKLHNIVYTIYSDNAISLADVFCGKYRAG